MKLLVFLAPTAIEWNMMYSVFTEIAVFCFLAGHLGNTPDHGFKGVRSVLIAD